MVPVGSAGDEGSKSGGDGADFPAVLVGEKAVEEEEGEGDKC